MKTRNLARPIWVVLIDLFLIAAPMFTSEAQAGEPQPGASDIVTSSDGGFTTTIPDQAESARAEPTVHISSGSVPPGTIIVDGNPSEWQGAGIGPLITDPPGDQAPAGLDALSLRVTDDGINVYFLYEFAGPPVDFSYLLLDVDTDASTGCNVRGVGYEYGVTFTPSNIPASYIGDGQDCGWGADDFPGALTAAVGGRFIEASVPIDILKILYPNLTEFDITCANDSCDIGRYTLGPQDECILEQELTFGGGSLTMGYLVGTQVQATWTVWLVLLNPPFAIPLWSVPLPILHPPITPDVSFLLAGFGTVAAFTVLTTSNDGVICSDWDTVNTGPPSEGGGSLQDLRELLARPDGLLPR